MDGYCSAPFPYNFANRVTLQPGTRLGSLLVKSLVDGTTATPFTLVVNWPELLKQKNAETR
jgi:hypothetical protein